MIISNCSGVARDNLSKNKNSLKKFSILSPPGGFSDHEGGHLLGLDLAHIVLYTASLAGIYPYIVVNALQRVIWLEQLFKQSFKHNFPLKY